MLNRPAQGLFNYLLEYNDLKQKPEKPQAHSYREQVCVCQGWGRWGWGSVANGWRELTGTNFLLISKTSTAWFKIGNSSSFYLTIWKWKHLEICKFYPSFLSPASKYKTFENQNINNATTNVLNSHCIPKYPYLFLHSFIVDHKFYKTTWIELSLNVILSRTAKLVRVKTRRAPGWMTSLLKI